MRVIRNHTFVTPPNPEAETIKPLIAVLNTGAVPSGIGSPLMKQDNKQRGPTILHKEEYFRD